jgi:hypothetical protein
MKTPRGGTYIRRESMEIKDHIEDAISAIHRDIGDRDPAMEDYQEAHAHALIAIAKALVDLKAAIVMAGPR